MSMNEPGVPWMQNLGGCLTKAIKKRRLWTALDVGMVEAAAIILRFESMA
jgi:hypothetical protein